MPLQVDIAFEGPLAQALASAAAQRQQRSKQERHRQPKGKERDKAVAKSNPPDAAAGHQSASLLPLWSAAESHISAQRASSAIPEPSLTLQELALGCMRRMFSADYRQALLQCQAGGVWCLVSILMPAVWHCRSSPRAWLLAMEALTEDFTCKLTPLLVRPVQAAPGPAHVSSIV